MADDSALIRTTPAVFLLHLPYLRLCLRFRQTSGGSTLEMELAFVAADIEQAYARTLEAGASEIIAPRVEPRGQKVSCVRCPGGSLIELCTPMSA